ncbi:MAG: hypothetical protein QXT69_06515 [Fervidicoccaceae archaeon]
MPFSRKIIAADQNIAEELLELAKKRNMSMYNLTNKALETYLLLYKAKINEPENIALDLILFDTLKTMGFRLQPPRIPLEDVEQLGKVIYEVARARFKQNDPAVLIERLATLFVGETNIFPEWGNEKEKRLIINLSIDHKESMDFLYMLFRGISSAALGNEGNWNVEKRDGIIVVTIKRTELESVGGGGVRTTQHIG